ncbi:hypothetical protein MFRU_006g01840 [Monilinia fructicola]|uniref:Uncharacterized protein n=1 Tax=Monilinia fructicola TaxID=38448 RepID=A0A5M9JB72_MONFR|nr:hypothetical protein EYC84_009455 [Monilinia fructicola]KAG4032719.1 hypothetical protein MFRU_006g01840 [Monilinia fructicola]
MPSKRRQSESGAPRRVSSRTKRASRQFVRELCVGCILWLPEKVAGGESVKCILPQCRCNNSNNSELDSEGYKHYVVILDVFQTADNKTQCYVAKLTSQTGKYPIDRIKIYQEASTSPPDEVGGLFLEHGSMPKQSFISLDHAYQLSPQLLRPMKTEHHACDRRLAEHSYTYLMDRLGLKAAKYQNTNLAKQLGAAIRTATTETPLLTPTPTPRNSAVDQRNLDHEALHAAFTLPPPPAPSKPTKPTPQTRPHRSTSSTNREANASEPGRETIAPRSALEIDALLQRYRAQRRELERARARVRDLESGRDGEGAGPGFLDRCAGYLLGRTVYAVEHAPWEKVCWVAVIMVALYYAGILKAVWPTVQVLGGWLKGAGLWTWRWMVKMIKVLVPCVKDLVVGAAKLIFKFVQVLAGCLKGLCVRAWGGISELVKSSLGQVGFG